jgi:hypothetical protein
MKLIYDKTEDVFLDMLRLKKIRISGMKTSIHKIAIPESNTHYFPLAWFLFFLFRSSLTNTLNPLSFHCTAVYKFPVTNVM